MSGSEDTQLAITDDANTTVVPGASGADVAELAWSAEQPETPPGVSPWRDRVRWATLAVTVITLAGATGWLATLFYEEQWATPVTAAAPPSREVVASAAPPARVPESTAEKALPSPGPPAQHEEAPSPPPQAPSPPAAGVPPPLPDPPAHAYDTYVQLLARDGIISTNSPQEMHDQAYWVCRAVSTGDTTRLNTIIVESQLRDALLTPAQIRTMLTYVVVAYCPEYRSLLN
ncbi:DUF732 domain-containing protein [Mycobacterium sp. E2479]|uniref:DUF732 domain-containing protein n=1 Tax=Mycobacterium sp. E2479 TaxID=1834134 RepID=UPI0007FC6D05|nr:DUF732 domain-containing protein [Mycobacterium sp. E2479]OBH55415.1 hypothetical protein A5686_06085 [Mycobacterium sp. E2479]